MARAGLRTSFGQSNDTGLVRCRRERHRPATVLLDDLVDLRHDADRLAQCNDDSLVVFDILRRERAGLAVFKPLLADLVAADVEVPNVLRYAGEAARRVSDVQPSIRVGPDGFVIHETIACYVQSVEGTGQNGKGVAAFRSEVVSVVPLTRVIVRLVAAAA